MIVGSKKDAVNVADIAASYAGGSRLVPRLLADGRFALPDNAKTDSRLPAAARSVLASWETVATPVYRTGHNTGVDQYRLMFQQGDIVYRHQGSMGNGSLTMPSDSDVYRFSAGPNSRPVQSDIATTIRRTQIGVQGMDGNPEGADSGQTAWCSYCLVVGDMAAANSGMGTQIMQWHQTGTGTSPPASVDTANGKIRVLTLSTQTPTRQDHYIADLPEPGVKDYWVQQVKFGPDGFINVWRNGVQVVKVTIPIGYQTGSSMMGWFNIGVYGWASPLTDTFYAANPEWSLNSLADRITNPLPVPDLDWSA